MWMTKIIDHKPYIAMERLSFLEQHSRAFGGELVKRLGLRRWRASGSGQSPIKTTKSDPDSPAEQSVCLIDGYLNYIVRIRHVDWGDTFYDFRHRAATNFSSIRLAEPVKFENDVIDLLLQGFILDVCAFWIEIAEA